MTDLPAHPMESAIVEALTQGLEALPVSLPPASEVLAAAREPGAAAPSAAAMAGVTEFVADGAAGGAWHGLAGFLSHSWMYVAGAVLVLVATVGVGAGLQYHGDSAAPTSSTPPAAPAPSGGGSQAVGGWPGGTPTPTSVVTPVPPASPPPTVVPTPRETPVPAAPARPSTPAPTPVPTAAPTPVPTPAPTPVPTSTPTPRRLRRPPLPPLPGPRRGGVCGWWRASVWCSSARSSLACQGPFSLATGIHFGGVNGRVAPSATRWGNPLAE